MEAGQEGKRRANRTLWDRKGDGDHGASLRDRRVLDLKTAFTEQGRLYQAGVFGRPVTSQIRKLLSDRMAGASVSSSESSACQAPGNLRLPEDVSKYGCVG